jgi:uncharacterized surface protein with fasciclin (FAS1) repeats
MKTLTKNSRFFVIAAILGLAVFVASCNKDEDVKPTEISTDIEALKGGNGAPAPGDSTIAELAIANGFTELVNALTYVDTALNAGLVDLFQNGTDQYTVFAPDNDAFFALYSALGAGAITDLPAPLVLDVLLYHVTEGRRFSKSVVPPNPRNTRTIKTLLGEKFSVDFEGNIEAIGSTATITAPDISASNGIIHVIDGVLLPIE